MESTKTTGRVAIHLGATAPKVKKRRGKAEATLAGVLGAQRPLRRRLTAIAFAMRLTPIVVPVALRFFLDPLLDRRALRIAGADLTPARLLAALVIVGILVAVVRAATNYLFVAWAGRCGHAVVADLRQKMFEQILRLPCRYVDRRGTGKVLLRFIGDSDALRSWISRTAPSVVADRIVLGVLVVVMFVIDSAMAMAILAPGVLLVLAARRLADPLRAHTRRSRQLQAELTGHIEARITHLRQAKWLDRNRKNRRLTRQLVDRIADQNIARDRQAARLQGAGELLAFLCIPFALAIGIWSVWEHRLTVGQFIAFAWLGAHAAVVIHRLNAALVVEHKAKVSVERILRLLERSPERGRSSKLRKLKRRACSLAISNLVFTTQGLGSPVNPLNLTGRGPGMLPIAAQVDHRALYEIMLGLRQAQSGHITFGAQRLDQIQVQSLRRAIAWIPARPAVFEGTVFDNIRLAAPDTDRAAIVRCASLLFDTPQCAEAWLDRDVGVGGHRLSPDDPLRIGFLRAAAGRAQFVLIEPNACLTPTIRKLINCLAKRTLVLVAEETFESSRK